MLFLSILYRLVRCLVGLIAVLVWQDLWGTKSPSDALTRRFTVTSRIQGGEGDGAAHLAVLV